MSGLKGKIVIVTGASSGIGAQTAVEFAKVGAQVVLMARRQNKLEETAAKCYQAGLDKTQVLQIPTDVMIDGDLHRAVDKTVQTFGAIDVLVNNAGDGVYASFEDTTEEDMDRMYRMHVRSVFTLTKLALPYLKRSKGEIQGLFAYSIAKCAQDHMMKGAALDLGPLGIRYNSVCPGTIDTDIFASAGKSPEAVAQLRQLTAQIHPAKRIGQPEEVAKVILFLASSDASFVSGVNMPVDSGRYNTQWAKLQ